MQNNSRFLIPENFPRHHLFLGNTKQGIHSRGINNLKFLFPNPGFTPGNLNRCPRIIRDRSIASGKIIEKDGFSYIRRTDYGNFTHQKSFFNSSLTLNASFTAEAAACEEMVAEVTASMSLPTAMWSFKDLPLNCLKKDLRFISEPKMSRNSKTYTSKTLPCASIPTKKVIG